MQEIWGDIWGPFGNEGDAVLRCVTTNGIVKRNGELVMGAGIAKQAANRYPALPRLLGQGVRKHGNVPLLVEEIGIISFPTKHNWKNKSVPSLILKSAERIAKLADYYDHILMTRPGCGLGGLNWEEVKAMLEPIFTGNKFWVFCGKK